MSGADPQTLALYDARAAEYAAVVKSAAPEALLVQFIAALPPGGAVLDLGCGPGTDAGHMARAGLVVQGLDASAGMVQQAGAVPGVAARLMDFDGFAAAGMTAAYDGIWANFSLLHAPRDRMPVYLAAIARALRPKGRLHIAVKTGTGAGRDSLGRLYTYYTPAELTGLLRDADLDVTAQVPGCDAGFDGVAAPWIAIAATRLPLPPRAG